MHMCGHSDPEIKCNVPMPEYVEQAVAFVIHQAQHRLAEINSLPMFFYGLGENDDMFIADMSDKPSALVQQAMRHAAQEHKVKLIMCLTEAWTLPPETLRHMIETDTLPKSVADRDDKIEVMVLSVETYDGTWQTKTEFVQKGPYKELPNKIVFQYSADGNVGNKSFSNLLPPKGPAPGTLLH